MDLNRCAAALAGLALACSYAPATAVQVVPLSYSAPNGYSGTYQYWDDLYTGSGCKTCNGAALSGGLGDLTDGVIASLGWSAAEAPAGPGPYVGWFGINPVLTFNFGSQVQINSATFYFDDASTNGVNPPLAVVINGQSYPVPNPVANVPFAFTVSSLALDVTSLNVSFIRDTNWVFASEVRFDGVSVVPESSSAMMLAAGAAFLTLALRRRNARPNRR